jgi:hypothetical protein
MRAFRFVTILYFISAPALAADFQVNDETLAALPMFPEGVVRAHPAFVGYEACRVVGRPVNLGAEDMAVGYFATTADECGWLAASGPLWVVQRIDGVLQVVLADRGYSAVVSRESRNGLRHIVISSLLGGSFFRSLWEFNGTRYVNTGERTEVAD